MVGVEDALERLHEIGHRASSGWKIKGGARREREFVPDHSRKSRVVQLRSRRAFRRSGEPLSARFFSAGLVMRLTTSSL